MAASSSKAKKKVMILSLAAVLLAVVCFAVYDVFFRKTAASHDSQTSLSEDVTLAEQGNLPKPSQTSDLDAVAVTLADYKVFRLSEVDFQFVIAKIHVAAKAPINISLSHFKTSEGTTLDTVDSYVAKLEKNSYFLGRQNVWFSLISEQSEYDANIFIPVIDKNASSITVACDFGSNPDLKFDLNSHAGSGTLLQYQAEDVITDGKTYQMTVSAAYDITGDYMYQTRNGQDTEYLLPSTTKVYAFKVEAVSLWGDAVTLESAEYVPNNSTETFAALDSSIRSMKFANLLGVEIKEKDSGYLFFVAYDPDDHPVTYQGVLRLKLKDADNSIVVNVNLN